MGEEHFYQSGHGTISSSRARMTSTNANDSRYTLTISTHSSLITLSIFYFMSAQPSGKRGQQANKLEHFEFRWSVEGYDQVGKTTSHS